MAADFTSVPTVELLTRAADAAGQAAAEADLFGPMRGWSKFLDQLRSYMPLGRRDAQLLAASGPDHWRAVEATLRDAASRAALLAPRHAERLTSGLRPLAEQVLRDIGDMP